MMAEWFGPRMFTNPVCTLDVWVGGGFRIVMRAPDGNDYPFKGEYLEVDAPNRLVYTNDGSEHGEEWLDRVYPHRDRSAPLPKPTTEVTFEALGPKKTRLHIVMTFDSELSRDGHTQHGMYEGWSDSFDDLAEIVTAAEGKVFLQVTRRFTLPAERVFDAWLDPKGVGQWLFKTPTGVMGEISIDARVGGRFLVVERRGEVDAKHFGEYLEIDRPRRLVFNFSDTEAFLSPALIEIDFTPVEGGCEVQLRHTMNASFSQWTDQTRAGWTSILTNLARTLGMSGGFFPGDHA